MTLGPMTVVLAMPRAARSATVLPHCREVGAGGAGIAVVVYLDLHAAAVPADNLCVGGAPAAAAMLGIFT